MLRTRRKLTVALALAVVIMGSLPAAAAGGGRARAPQGVLELAGGFVEWAWRQLQTVWTKEGPCIDPNGRCAPTATGGKSSACIDPNGSPCAASSESDKGSSIDPNGTH